jgi:hypothetical protein
LVTPTSSKLVKVLHSTLKRLETSEELASDDPALAELKGSLLSNITELEVAKTPKPLLSPQKILWIAPRPGKDLEEVSPTEASPAAPPGHSSPVPVAEPAADSPAPQSETKGKRSRKSK